MMQKKSSFNALFAIVSLAGACGPAVADSLMQTGAGDVTSRRHSGTVLVGEYSGNRINIDNNEIQSQNCVTDPCNPVTLYLQREGGPTYIGGVGNSILVMHNPDESSQHIRFADVQNSNEYVHVGFNSGQAGRGLQVYARDDGNSARYEFRANGNAYKSGGGSWSALSDRRVKQDVEQFSLGLDELLRIKPVTYQYNGKGGTLKSGNRHVGVIAQQIQTIDGLRDIALSTEQRYLEPSDGTETELLSFDPSALIYVAINAIQELESEVATLKAKNIALENKLIKLGE